MGVKRFKCKRCKTRFDLASGREIIQACVDACEKPACPLRNKSLAYIPLAKDRKTLSLPKKAVNDSMETVEEYYEEEPINGFISGKEIRKKHG